MLIRYCNSQVFEMRIQPGNLIFIIGYIIYAAIRGVFEKRTRGTEKVINRFDTRDRLLILVMFFGGLLLPVLYLFTPLLAFADYQLPRWAWPCGTIIIIAALWLFWRAHSDLGLNWSISLQVRKGHRLVRNGVYRWIRHPMYAAIWLFSLAQALLLQNWLAGLSGLAAFAFMYFVRAPLEEQMMSEFFGQEYHNYMRQTGRLFPRIRSKREGDQRHTPT